MQLSITPFLTLLSLSLAPALTHAQAVAGGGAAAGGGVVATTAATQSPPVITGPSLQTVGGTTIAVQGVVFTQTFAATALGTWPLGTVVSAGSVGLGTIQGIVGGTAKKTKRAAMPSALFGSW